MNTNEENTAFVKQCEENFANPYEKQYVVTNNQEYCQFSSQSFKSVT